MHLRSHAHPTAQQQNPHIEIAPEGQQAPHRGAGNLKCGEKAFLGQQSTKISLTCQETGQRHAVPVAEDASKLNISEIFALDSEDQLEARSWADRSQRLSSRLLVDDPVQDILNIHEFEALEPQSEEEREYLVCQNSQPQITEQGAQTRQALQAETYAEHILHLRGKLHQLNQQMSLVTCERDALRAEASLQKAQHEQEVKNFLHGLDNLRAASEQHIDSLLKQASQKEAELVSLLEEVRQQKSYLGSRIHGLEVDLETARNRCLMLEAQLQSQTRQMAENNQNYNTLLHKLESYLSILRQRGAEEQIHSQCEQLYQEYLQQLAHRFNRQLRLIRELQVSARKQAEASKKTAEEKSDLARQVSSLKEQLLASAQQVQKLQKINSFLAPSTTASSDQGFCIRIPAEIQSEIEYLRAEVVRLGKLIEKPYDMASLRVAKNKKQDENGRSQNSSEQDRKQIYKALVKLKEYIIIENIIQGNQGHSCEISQKLSQLKFHPWVDTLKQALTRLKNNQAHESPTQVMLDIEQKQGTHCIECKCLLAGAYHLVQSYNKVTERQNGRKRQYVKTKAETMDDSRLSNRKTVMQLRGQHFWKQKSMSQYSSRSGRWRALR